MNEINRPALDVVRMKAIENKQRFFFTKSPLFRSQNEDQDKHQWYVMFDWVDVGSRS